VALVQSSAIQQISSEKIVAPDGTVNLGIYGSVYITGMTLDEARHAIEERLSEFLEDPKVSLDVFAYNSKFYYIVIEGAGFGDQVVQRPVVGNETVLDAIAALGGLSQLSSKRIWISRPAPQGVGCDQVLPVDWNAITRNANAASNYQLLPGDRIFVNENQMYALGGFVNRILNPIERVFGFTLLGSQTIQTLQRFPGGGFFF
jgi:protein involved in polysaccharide export with SLBB domain